MGDRNLRTVSTIALGALLLICGCGVAPSKSAGSQVPAVVALATPTGGAGPATTQRVVLATPVATQPSPPVPVGQVQDCVDYVQYGAFTGNAILLGLWNTAGQDVTKLRAECTSIGVSDPATLAATSTQWTAIQTYISASQTTQASPPTTSTPAPPPKPPPTPPPTTAAPRTPTTSPPTTAAPSCSAGSYVNVDGNCIPRPVSAPSAPAGATAQCNDGTYSFSQHRRGTCSHHGGVAVWL
jgi:hypothetical protein